MSGLKTWAWTLELELGNTRQTTFGSGTSIEFIPTSHMHPCSRQRHASRLEVVAHDDFSRSLAVFCVLEGRVSLDQIF